MSDRRDPADEALKAAWIAKHGVTIVGALDSKPHGRETPFNALASKKKGRTKGRQRKFHDDQSE